VTVACARFLSVSSNEKNEEINETKPETLKETTK
jgi:hypothetical protein